MPTFTFTNKPNVGQHLYYYYTSVDMYLIKEKKENIFNLLKLTIFFNLGTFLQFRRWEWVSSMETKICPKGSISRTKEDCPTVTHTKRYIHFKAEKLVHGLIGFVGVQ